MRAVLVAKLIALAALLSGVLHLVWENAQAPFYAGYESFGQHFWICLAVIPGDVVITLLIYGLVAAWRRDATWPRQRRWQDAAAVALVGAAVAVALERHAISAGRWSYTAAMPVIPYLGVGLTPVLQMAILLPLSFYLAGKLLR